MRRGLRSLLAAVATAALGGCAGGEVEPPDRHYRLLIDTPPALEMPALPGVLLVKRFTADGLIAQRAVVYARAPSPGALFQYNYHFWAETPTVMLQELVARALRAARVAQQVTTPAHGVTSSHVLVGRIERLEHLLGDAPAVAVALELAVFDGERRELVWLARYAEELPVGAPGVGPAVRVAGVALSRILARFVADLAAR